MVIQHNLAALNAHRNLSINNKGTAGNLEKLSSGFRINRAADDAAGLAISEKMRGQIRGLGMAEMNVDHAISLIQTAEGGLNEVHAILHRMRELGVQASNGTYVDDDRAQIAIEVQALKDEIDRISASTHYNGIKLLDGTLGGTTITTDNMNQTIADVFGTGVVATGTTSATDVSFVLTKTVADLLEIDLNEGSNCSAQIIVSNTKDGGPHVSLQVGDKTYELVRDATSGVYGVVDDSNVHQPVIAFVNNETTKKNVAPSNEGVICVDFKWAAAGSADSSGTVGATSLDNYDNAMVAGLKDELIFQIGANGGADQRVGLHVANMSTAHLGNKDGLLRDITVETREEANDAIDVIDAAVQMVSATRAQLGSLQNRLEHTLNNLGVTKENLTAAESTIRDVDMAKEMMEFTKNNILVQASQAMLAQANALPQGVLSLLQ